jgi:hypothetical protein
MERGTNLRSGLVRVYVKLRVLKDSCDGVAKSRSYPPGFSWFEGAAAICQETLDLITEVLGIIEKPKVDP